MDSAAYFLLLDLQPAWIERIKAAGALFGWNADMWIAANAVATIPSTATVISTSRSAPCLKAGWHCPDDTGPRAKPTHYLKGEWRFFWLSEVNL